MHILRNTLIVAALVGLFSFALAQAPTTPYAVGVRQYNWMRGGRAITTYVFYPATGTAGGSPVWDAPAASGVFPVYQYTHGLGGDPKYSTFAPGLASAGFIVPAPHFQHNLGDVNSGETSRDVSQVITNTLALNSSGPLAGRIRTDLGVGVCGHSMGGMTTHGLLTSWPDSRIISAIPMSTLDMGTPSSSVRAKVMFVHGDQDSTTAYSSGRQAYSEMPAPKAFLTFVGGGHSSFWDDPVFRTTVADWARWSMYGDTAARDRLASDATASHTRWESVGVEGGGTTYYKLRNRATTLCVDGMGRTANGSACGQYASGTSMNQQWSLEVAGSYVKLRNRATSLYLDGAGRTSNGSTAAQWSSSTSNNQQWTEETSASGYYRYRNRGTGLYLDGMGRTSNGADLGQWSSSSSSNQQFSRVQQ